MDESNQPPAAPAPAEDRMPSLKERYTEQEVEDAIRKCNGRWASIVHCLNCSYDQLRVWMEHHRSHDKLSKDLRMAFVDEAEDQLWQLMNSTDAKLRADIAKFVLKTLGKTRGWSEAPSSQIVQQISTEDKAVQIRNIFGLPEEKKEQNEEDTELRSISCSAQS